MIPTDLIKSLPIKAPIPYHVYYCSEKPIKNISTILLRLFTFKRSTVIILFEQLLVPLNES